MGKLPYFINEHGLCLKLSDDVIPYINALNEILNEIGNMSILKYESLAMMNPTFLQSKYNLNDNFIKWWDDVVKYKLYKLLPNVIDDYITGFEIVNTPPIEINYKSFYFGISFDNLLKKIESDNITKDNFDYYFFDDFLCYKNICKRCHMDHYNNNSCYEDRFCYSCAENLKELCNLYYTYNLFCDYKKYINEAVNNLLNSHVKIPVRSFVLYNKFSDLEKNISIQTDIINSQTKLIQDLKEELQKQRKEFLAYKAEK